MWLRKRVVLSILYVVTLNAPCSGKNLFGKMEACKVKYLISTGKQNVDFPTAQPPILCKLTDLVVQDMKTSEKSQLKIGFPKSATCLTYEFEKRELVDLLLKILIIERSTILDERTRKKQLKQIKNAFKSELEKIAELCEVDNKSLMKMYSSRLGVKRESTKTQNNRYCLIKYAVDQHVFKLEVKVNRYHIDPNTFDCDRVIGLELNKRESFLKYQLDESPFEKEEVDCIIQAYKNESGFDSRIALKVLDYLDVNDDEKYAEFVRISDDSIRFYRKILSKCL